MFRATVVLGLLSLAVGLEVPEIKDRITKSRGIMIKDVACVVSVQKRGVHKCGGFIIGDNKIMTAAHCIEPMRATPIQQLTVRMGSSMWSIGGQSIKIQSMISHPKYDPPTKNFDAGVLILQKSVEYDDTVKKCTMAKKCPTDGENALICGWGLRKEGADMLPNMLQAANVTTISKQKCSSGDYDYHGAILGTMFCAKNDGKDACQGDSGGPLMIKSNEVSGIISYGAGCGREKSPGVYTCVASVADWVKGIP